MDENKIWRKREMVVLALGLMIGWLLILRAAQGDLWIDEIWSVYRAETAKSAGELVTVLQHDNNHLLNSFYLYAIGPQQNFLWYRLLSVICGALALMAFAFSARRFGKFETIAIVYLIALSFPFMLYFSEARGYAAAILFSLLGFELFQAYESKPSIYKLIGLWLIIIAGLLAHLTFVLVFCALFWATAAKEIKEGNGKKLPMRLFSHYGIPCLFFVVYYIVFIHRMKIGGGPVYGKFQVICQAAAIALGFSERGPMSYVAFVLAMMIIGYSIWKQYRSRQDSWLFYLTILIIAPVLLLLVTRPEFFYFRYFILCFPFFYFLLVRILGEIYRSGKKGQMIAMVLVVIFIGLQSMRIVPFLQKGRGAYSVAVQDMTKADNKIIIVIGGDHDFRNPMLLTFYFRFVKGRRFQYVEKKNWHKKTPQWFLIHSQDNEKQFPEKLTLPSIGKEYQLFKSYPYSGFSGWNWYVYRICRK